MAIGIDQGAKAACASIRPHAGRAGAAGRGALGSRTQRHIADYVRAHRLQRKLRAMYARLPPAARRAGDLRETDLHGCDATLHIVRLRYAGLDWRMASKDINFSRGSIEWRRDQGYADAQRAVRHAGWLRTGPSGAPVLVHELPGHDGSGRQAD